MCHLNISVNTEQVSKPTIHALVCVCSYIYGRGAMDLKFTVIALLEAVDELVKSGW